MKTFIHVHVCMSFPSTLLFVFVPWWQQICLKLLPTTDLNWLPINKSVIFITASPLCLCFVVVLIIFCINYHFRFRKNAFNLNFQAMFVCVCLFVFHLYRVYWSVQGGGSSGDNELDSFNIDSNLIFLIFLGFQ